MSLLKFGINTRNIIGIFLQLNQIKVASNHTIEDFT